MLKAWEEKFAREFLASKGFDKIPWCLLRRRSVKTQWFNLSLLFRQSARRKWRLKQSCKYLGCVEGGSKYRTSLQRLWDFLFASLLLRPPPPPFAFILLSSNISSTLALSTYGISVKLLSDHKLKEQRPLRPKKTKNTVFKKLFSKVIE